MGNLDKAIFIASIAPIMTGLSTGNDGMRIKLDIPETEMGEAAKLLAMRGQVLRVSVEVERKKNKLYE